MARPTHSQIKAALVRARTIIADPKRWTQGEYRRHLPGHTTEDEPEAYAYCALGAVQQAWNYYGNDPLLERDTTGPIYTERSLQEALLKMIGTTSVIRWNDNFQRSHGEVVSLFDAAIERESALAQLEVQS